MAIRNVQLIGDCVTTAKIAADAVIPADIDETQAFNFSSTSGTIGGVLNTNLVDKAAGELVTGGWTLSGACNISGASSTIDSIAITNLVDKAAIETVSGAWDLQSTTGTFSGVLDGRMSFPVFTSGRQTSISAGSTVIPFTATMADTPNVTVTIETTSTAAAWAGGVDSIGTTGFTLYTNTSGTYQWMAKIPSTA